MGEQATVAPDAAHQHPITGRAERTVADSTAVHQLQTREHANLLDAIDRLRREGIGAEIGIPQIVVCGDQSSGKSSVLEAIAQVPFPIGKGTTTRFATEVVLRNAPEAKINIHISPWIQRNEAERQSIAQWKPTFNVQGPADFARLLEAATTHLKTYDHGHNIKFWYDRLCVQISGPSQPHLTLVDLPGLIQTEADDERSDNPARIMQLVKECLNNPRTVVLAVVNVRTDLENQASIKLIRDMGDAKDRTLGIITNPDRIEGIDETREVVSLARNEKLRLGLGWHLLKNLSHEALDRSANSRDEEERKFFGSGTWLDLSS